MELIESNDNYNVYRAEGQAIIEWKCLEVNYIESMQSELVSIVRDRPFGIESEGFYVYKDLPDYGLAIAQHIPVEEEDMLIDLGW